MKKFFLLSVIVIGLVSCQATKHKSGVLPLELEFVELAYGVGESDMTFVDEMKESPSGTQNTSLGYKIVEQTDQIKGKRNNQFGLTYMIKAKSTVNIDLQAVWIYPEIIVNDKGESYKELKYMTSRTTNFETYSSYTFDEDYEIVKGEWIYQLYYNGKLLHERKFYVN